MIRLLCILLFLGSAGEIFSQPQQEVKRQVDSLVYYMRNKNTELFAENTVYRGDDPKRKWKDVYNASNPEELKAAKLVLLELKEALAGCHYKEFDIFLQKEESEGTWYIYTYACGAHKRIKLAFLKLKGRYAIGDIDVEEDDEEN